MPKTIKERNRVIQTNSTQRLDHALLKDRRENFTHELRYNQQERVRKREAAKKASIPKKLAPLGLK